MLMPLLDALMFFSGPALLFLGPLVRWFQDMSGRNNYWLASKAVALSIAIDIATQYDENLKQWYFGAPSLWEVFASACMILGFVLPLHRAAAELEAKKAENCVYVEPVTHFSLLFLLSITWPLTLLAFLLSGANIANRVAFSVDLWPVIPEALSLVSMVCTVLGCVAGVLPPKQPRKSKLTAWLKEKLASRQYRVALATARSR